MPLYAITCIDKPDSLHLRKTLREAHLDYAHQYEDRIIIGGPLLSAEGTAVGSMLVIRLPDEDTARAWSANDPFAKAGLFESVTVSRYAQVMPPRPGAPG